jgi:hypothetical protein
MGRFVEKLLPTMKEWNICKKYCLFPRLSWNLVEVGWPSTTEIKKNQQEELYLMDWLEKENRQLSKKKNESFQWSDCLR